MNLNRVIISTFAKNEICLHKTHKNMKVEKKTSVVNVEIKPGKVIEIRLKV